MTRREGRRIGWRWTAVLMGVLVVALWTGTGPAQRPGMGWYGMGPGMGGFHMTLPLLVKGVGLTESQQAQVKQIVAAHQPQFQALASQLRSAHDQVAQKLYAPGPLKADDLAPLTQQIGQLRGQLAQEALQVALEVRGVLTPEQLAKAEQIRRKLNDLRAEMRTLLGRDQ